MEDDQDDETVRFLNICVRVLGCIILVVIVPTCVYHGIKYYRYRYHTVLIKRYSNLSFHQLSFLIMNESILAVLCLFTGWGVSKSPMYYYIFRAYLFSFVQLGFLWATTIRYWHLWYDINYVTASITHRWYEIIAPNIDQRHGISKFPFSINCGNACCCNRNRNHYKIGTISTTMSTEEPHGNDNNGNGAGKDLHAIASGTVSPKPSKLAAPISPGFHHVRNASNISDIIDEDGAIIPINNNGSGNKMITFKSERGVLQPQNVTWFLHHKSTLGNYKHTLKLLYIVVPFFATIFTTFYILVDHGFKSIFFVTTFTIIFFLCAFVLPLIFLCLLYSQLQYRLKFEDNFFVGTELKYLFGCMVFNMILGALGITIMQSINSYSSSTNYLVHVGVGSVAVIMGFMSLSYLTMFLILTKRVLKKLEGLLKDKQFVTNKRNSSDAPTAINADNFVQVMFCTYTMAINYIV